MAGLVLKKLIMKQQKPQPQPHHIDSCIIGFWRMGANKYQIKSALTDYVDASILYIEKIIEDYKIKISNGY